LDWLGRKWNDIIKDLAENEEEFTYEIINPVGRFVSYGDLRVVRVRQVEGKLKFILLHDRFNKLLSC
jgi:hypothetical protein